MKTQLNKTLITLGIAALAFAVQNVQSQPANSDGDGNMNNAGANPNYRESNSRMSAGRDANSPLTAQHFVWEAATTDQKEIHAGELALQKSDNADVKSFAKHLISDHKKSCKKLQAIAEKENLSFPDTNSIAMNEWQNHRNANDGFNSNSNWNGTATGETANMSSDHQMTQGLDQHFLKGAELTEYNNFMMTNDEEMNEHHGEMSNHSVMLESLSGAEFDRAFADKMVKGHEKAISKFEMAANNLQDEDLKKYAEKTLPTLREHLKMAQELQSKVGMSQDSGMTNSMPNQNQ